MKRIVVQLKSGSCYTYQTALPRVRVGTKVIVPPPYWCPEMGASVGKVVSFKSDYAGQCVTITSKA